MRLPHLQQLTHLLLLLGALCLGVLILLPGKLLPLPLQPFLSLLLIGLLSMAQLIDFWDTRRHTRCHTDTKDVSSKVGRKKIIARPTAAPLTLIILWLSVNLWSSADRSTSWIAIGYLLFGISLYVLSTRLSSTVGSVCLASIPLIGTTLAILFPFIATWKPQFRLFYLPLYDYLRGLQLNFGETVHPNIVAGALILTLPITIVLSLWPDRNSRWSTFRYVGLVFTLLQFGALFLSQSRGGYLAISAALMTLLLLRWPRLGYLLPIGLVGIFLLIRGIGIATILDQFSSDSALGGWSGRLEIWQTSLTAIADFPFTGIGIGTFVTVIPLLYPLSFPIESYPHAHNLFLQIALDLGLPGLIAYLALIINLIAMLIVTLRKAPRHTMIHTLAIGAAGSLVGMLTHGLLDAVTWGTKLSFLPWILFALITQLFLHVQKEELASVGEENPKPA